MVSRKGFNGFALELAANPGGLAVEFPRTVTFAPCGLTSVDAWAEPVGQVVEQPPA